MDRESAPSPVPKNLQFRVGLLVGLAVVLGAGFVIYALYARGVFEDTQRLTLIAENAEGVDIGMDLTFSGFPIGRVKRLALDEQGRARIDIEVPRSDAHWLRETTVFTLERGLVGSARAVEQLNSLLSDVRDSLKRADSILADAEATASNAKAATTDLGALRREVDANVRKISGLIDEINRKWPFERKTEIRLP